MIRLIPPKQLPSFGINYHPSHLWRLIQQGKFPKPIRIGANRLAFVESELEQYIKSKIAERDTPSPPKRQRRAGGKPKPDTKPANPKRTRRKPEQLDIETAIKTAKAH